MLETTTTLREQREEVGVIRTWSCGGGTCQSWAWVSEAFRSREEGLPVTDIQASDEERTRERAVEPGWADCGATS